MSREFAAASKNVALYVYWEHGVERRERGERERESERERERENRLHSPLAQHAPIQWAI